MTLHNAKQLFKAGQNLLSLRVMLPAIGLHLVRHQFNGLRQSLVAFR